MSGDLTRPLLGPLLGRFLPIFTDVSDFLGRLQPSKTTIQRTLDTLGVEESSSPRPIFTDISLDILRWMPTHSIRFLAKANQEIARLDVTMDDVLCMSVHQRESW